MGPFRMITRKMFLSFAVLLIASTPVALLAQGTYTQIDYPGAMVTSCLGINKAGDITGFYEDSMDMYHGFLLSGGIYTTIDYPGAQYTTLYKINDVGQILGSADSFSFLYSESSQTFTQIVYPGSDATYATSINNAGAIGGFFTVNDEFSQGFKLVGSTYRRLPAVSTANVYVWGITADGTLVGYAQRHGVFDFSFDQGKYQQILPPNSPQVYGVNRAGTALVGPGYLYQSGAFQVLQFPGGGITYAYDVDNAGEVVGLFLDSSDGQHAFRGYLQPARPGSRSCISRSRVL
jgi:hypothetical protein